MSDMITISVVLRCTPQRAWEVYTRPEDIRAWNFANSSWHCPRAENDVKVGGLYSCRMETKDGSNGFDLSGVFVEVVPFERLKYTLGQGREVLVQFKHNGDTTEVVQSFTPDTRNPHAYQKAGWQAILENYRQHAERSE